MLALLMCLSVVAQVESYATTSYSSNYAVVDSTVHTGANVALEGHFVIQDQSDEHFGVNVGVGVGYTSLSNLSNELYGMATFGFSFTEYFDGGFVAQYTMASKHLGLGAYGDINIPIGQSKRLKLFGRGQLILSTNDKIAANPTVGSIGAGIKVSFK